MKGKYVVGNGVDVDENTMYEVLTEPFIRKEAEGQTCVILSDVETGVMYLEEVVSFIGNYEVCEGY